MVPFENKKEHDLSYYACRFHRALLTISDAVQSPIVQAKTLDTKARPDDLAPEDYESLFSVACESLDGAIASMDRAHEAVQNILEEMSQEREVRGSH